MLRAIFAPLEGSGDWNIHRSDAARHAWVLLGGTDWFRPARANPPPPPNPHPHPHPHPHPSTLTPQPSTLTLTLTLHPYPITLNLQTFKPSILTPQPSTLHPHPSPLLNSHQSILTP